MIPRTTPLLSVLAAALLALPAAVGAEPAAVVVDGGSAACSLTPSGAHLEGAASPASSRTVAVAADEGTLEIQVAAERGGPRWLSTTCEVDVLVTSHRFVGVALDPRGSVGDAVSAPCAPARDAPCVATASLAWAYEQLGKASVVVDGGVAADPSTGNVVINPQAGANPDLDSQGTAALEVSYEVGVTVDGARTVLYASTVTLVGAAE